MVIKKNTNLHIKRTKPAVIFQSCFIHISSIDTIL